ncbi:dephospho-CoA kinase [Crenobacter sp. SG2303]|uniref:Dephospho-CoA kinase n=1 Tax=Crenobacter oryzisoli TaxID=3056844 RepID=A0ABT7XU29_9NEIS|nr:MULTISPECIES: dephospho-CoA kinase [unclassified Crenobacter]MDN0077291.1 dephospho-CoA kinase [Crenobacter sp. SG2303]MDN0082169.1 dephospho-CoA kinase [Crenobacter sp. SG2305]
MVNKVVGLTGGIGSGKSTVAELFAERGVTVVDTDRISHQLTGPNGGAMAAIEAEFGSTVVRKDRALDREAMRGIVFSDPGARVRLEAILHPLIRAESERQLCLAEGPYALLVVPLLFETGHYDALLARVLVVDCSEEVQRHRVMQRNGLDEATVSAIMAAQLPRAERLARADDVIDNNDGLAALTLQVDAKHRYYLANLVADSA